MPTAPSPERLRALAARTPEGRLPRLNLLELRERAACADGRETGVTAAEACGLCAEGVARIIRDPGGRSIWRGATSTGAR